MAWLLDTNILSELRRPKPEPKVLRFIESLSLDDVYVSVATLAELRYGVELVTEVARRADLNAWLTTIIRPMFDRRVLVVTEDVLVRWRVMVEEGRKTGHTFSQPDLIIAATAAHHGMTVVTRDRRQFDKAGVPVVNPWDQAP
jgi:predicted nucleic acid-binding protein